MTTELLAFTKCGWLHPDRMPRLAILEHGMLCRRGGAFKNPCCSQFIVYGRYEVTHCMQHDDSMLCSDPAACRKMCSGPQCILGLTYCSYEKRKSCTIYQINFCKYFFSIKCYTVSDSQLYYLHIPILKRILNVHNTNTTSNLSHTLWISTPFLLHKSICSGGLMRNFASIQLLHT
jgi:hypothetical protein